MQGGLDKVRGIGPDRALGRMVKRHAPTPIADPWGEGCKDGRATGPLALNWPRDSPGLRKTDPLNNNRNNNNNNRRRGRGNNNTGGGRPQGGGNPQVNRIDSRARGNAPQLLEKYRKLAHDAHLNGDRVTAEYYLQFADHYFRVIADTRVRQEEARARRDDRWQEGGEGARDDSDDSAEFSVESDFPAFDQPPVYTRREREERPEPARTEQGRAEGRTDQRSEQRPDQRRRDEQPRREDTSRRDEQPRREAETVAAAPAEAPVEGQSLMYEPVENPFLREARATRAPRLRREDRRPARGLPRLSEDSDQGEPAGQPALDPALLPPSISAARKSEEPAVEAASDEAPKKRTRRKKVVDGAGDEPLQQVG